jgi:hypothetical protein
MLFLTGMDGDSRYAWLVALRSQMTGMESTMEPDGTLLPLWSVLVLMYTELGALIGLVGVLGFTRARLAGRTLVIYLALALTFGAAVHVTAWAATYDPRRLAVLAGALAAIAGLVRWAVLRRRPGETPPS